MRYLRANSQTGNVVADGYRRAVDGIDRQARREVEQKYSQQRSDVGIIKRWFLRRRMKREVAKLVAERSRHLSPDSLF